MLYPRTSVRPLSFILLLFSIHIQHAFSFPDKKLEAIRSTGHIQIDGKLDENVWKGNPISEFIQREPHEGEPSSERTDVWIAYDENALYVAARLYDSSPDSIVGRLARRDDDSESDLFALSIDPSLDRRTGFYFSVNPAGAIEDGTFYSDHQYNPSWDGIWETAARIDQRGWSVEMRIPYSQLRFSAKEEYVWGIDFRRRIQRKNEESYLVFHPRNDVIRVSQLAELHGIRGISPPARVELLPYITGTGKFIKLPPVESFNEGRSDPFVFGRDYLGNIGMDAKIGMGGDVTLDLAINPDFAQVEVDPAVVNLTAYEIFFAEKRSFFIEGSNIFGFGRGGVSGLQNFDWMDPLFFYSRRIGRAPQGKVTHRGFVNIPDRTTILGAAKISGKINNTWSMAALTALTARQYGEVDSVGIRLRDEIEPLTLYSVVRTQKEFNGARQGIGFIGSYLERDLREPRLQALLDQRAITAGVDGWTFLDDQKDWAISGWLGASSVHGSPFRLLTLQRSAQHYFQRPDAAHVTVDSSATSMVGWASRIHLNKEKGNWRFNMAFGAIHPKFESNDLGFLNNADFINTHIYASYNWFEPDKLFRWKYVAGAVHRTYDFGGFKTGDTYRVILVGEFANYWSSYLIFGYTVESFDNQRTRGGPLMKTLQSEFVLFRLGSDTRLPLSGEYSGVAAKGRSEGWIYTHRLFFTLKASKTVTLSGGPNFTRTHSTAQYITSRADLLALGTFGRQYIFADLDQTTLSTVLRLSWTFTPQLSFQLYLQPLFSVGKYSNLKELAKAGTYSFITYGREGSTKTESGGSYVIDPDGPGPRGGFVFSRERDFDFNFTSLRSNAVLRWEYLPGSTLYFVWTNVKAATRNDGEFDFGRDIQWLLRNGPDNVFSLKVTYWLNP